MDKNTQQHSYETIKDTLDRYTIVDTRPADYYQAGHIQGALSLPLQELAENPHALDDKENILFYCQKGISCQKAYQLLKEQGRQDVGFIKEGWEEIGQKA